MPNDEGDTRRRFADGRPSSVSSGEDSGEASFTGTAPLFRGLGVLDLTAVDASRFMSRSRALLSRGEVLDAFDGASTWLRALPGDVLEAFRVIAARQV
jgi:hypothetical protein